MTILIAWLGVDARGASSVYLASDSRISWSLSQNWDLGRKLFTCQSSPDIFGYVGDVVFPVTALGQIITAADYEVLPGFKEGNADARHAVFKGAVKKAYSRRRRAPERDFTLIHAARDSEGMQSEFRVWSLSYCASAKTWLEEQIAVNVTESTVVGAWGSGAAPFLNRYNRVKGLPQGRTSRAVMWALCDLLNNEEDPSSGGAPQLAGLYRQGPAQAFAVSFQGERQLFGLSVGTAESESKVEARDELFQRVAIESGTLVSGAQRHARASTLATSGKK